VPTSDAAANAALDREVTAGGSWWVGLALSMPDEHLTSVDEAPLARVQVPRDSSTWEPASGRTVHLAANLALPDAAEDFTPVAWVLWDSETGGTPQHCRRLVDVEVLAGSAIALPAETLALIYP
jgi:hypothetical protein